MSSPRDDGKRKANVRKEAQTIQLGQRRPFLTFPDNPDGRFKSVCHHSETKRTRRSDFSVLHAHCSRCSELRGCSGLAQ
ncbi:hypothetical protein chiPu_0001859 [Chiloscyllium punctatum]|uniref:Uncharacterized protein n=1 Tax=Chiloscyllium punctatum TaxID=137246 RepID=A0A401RZ90_CHIPU|nr:hypothetical protein [Chiloscyllium punctatum]